MVSVDPTPGRQHLLHVTDYDLGATLDSGQAFRWKQVAGRWTSVVGNRWVRLTPTASGIQAETASDTRDWQWLSTYLQADVNLSEILAQFPDDPLLAEAVRRHPGLRLLRQNPWECLASFILSSTKQIAHIKQIVEALCAAHGDPIPVPPGEPPACTFPSPARIAALDEAALRSLRMGFRAPYLLEAARRVDSRRLDLELLGQRPLAEARAALMTLPGVGRKIADCVLLFALGFDEAFPVDVWVMRALQATWFPHKPTTLPRLVAFSETRFGAYGGYAQQYLFHHARMQAAATRGHPTP